MRRLTKVFFLLFVLFLASCLNRRNSIFKGDSGEEPAPIACDNGYLDGSACITDNGIKLEFKKINTETNKSIKIESKVSSNLGAVWLCYTKDVANLENPLASSLLDPVCGEVEESCASGNLLTTDTINIWESTTETPAPFFIKAHAKVIACSLKEDTVLSSAVMELNQAFLDKLYVDDNNLETEDNGDCVLSFDKKDFIDNYNIRARMITSQDDGSAVGKAAIIEPNVDNNKITMSIPVGTAVELLPTAKYLRNDIQGIALVFSCSEENGITGSIDIEYKEPSSFSIKSEIRNCEKPVIKYSYVYDLPSSTLKEFEYKTDSIVDACKDTNVDNTGKTIATISAKLLCDDKKIADTSLEELKITCKSSSLGGV